MSDAIFEKIRSDRYLNSLCTHEKDYLNCTVSVYASFGPEEPELHSRTQVELRAMRTACTATESSLKRCSRGMSWTDCESSSSRRGIART